MISQMWLARSCSTSLILNILLFSEIGYAEESLPRKHMERDLRIYGK
jgi:hypothetical protein